MLLCMLLKRDGVSGGRFTVPQCHSRVTGTYEYGTSLY
jgi:hypothetical protein